MQCQLMWRRKAEAAVCKINIKTNTGWRSSDTTWRKWLWPIKLSGCAEAPKQYSTMQPSKQALPAAETVIQRNVFLSVAIAYSMATANSKLAASGAWPQLASVQAPRRIHKYKQTQ